MFLGFGCLYKFAMFYVFFFLKKAENNRFKKKASQPEFRNIMFLFLLKIGSVVPVDQQIKLVSPHTLCLYYVFLHFLAIIFSDVIKTRLSNCF